MQDSENKRLSDKGQAKTYKTVIIMYKHMITLLLLLL
jgi:hypothetical protein